MQARRARLKRVTGSGVTLHALVRPLQTHKESNACRAKRPGRGERQCKQTTRQRLFQASQSTAPFVVGVSARPQHGRHAAESVAEHHTTRLHAQTQRSFLCKVQAGLSAAVMHGMDAPRSSKCISYLHCACTSARTLLQTAVRKPRRTMPPASLHVTMQQHGTQLRKYATRRPMLATWHGAHCEPWECNASSVHGSSPGGMHQRWPLGCAWGRTIVPRVRGQGLGLSLSSLNC